MGSKSTERKSSFGSMPKLISVMEIIDAFDPIEVFNGTSLSFPLMLVCLLLNIVADLTILNTYISIESISKLNGIHIIEYCLK